jgi:hypothetical protein
MHKSADESNGFCWKVEQTLSLSRKTRVADIDSIASTHIGCLTWLPFYCGYVHLVTTIYILAQAQLMVK